VELQSVDNEFQTVELDRRLRHHTVIVSAHGCVDGDTLLLAADAAPSIQGFGGL
jgi:hypothetical protein